MSIGAKLKGHWLMIAGIILVLGGALVLAEANSKDAECQSVSGKIVQFLDSDTREDCAGVKTLRFLSYASLALGVAFMAINFIRRS
ncbi:hypothetical protein KY362_00405 [Candidatus Woesearchaeota archaeon]|nr:hypothetical protein [Candidatus Woesearchaeota archaeon]